MPANGSSGKFHKHQTLKTASNSNKTNLTSKVAYKNDSDEDFDEQHAVCGPPAPVVYKSKPPS